MKQTVSKIVKQEPKKDRRAGRGRTIALSRQMFNLSNRSTYYIESETTDNRYYFVRFEPSVFEWCSCMDYGSNRSEKCKHLYAVEYGIRFNTIKVVDKLPEQVQIKKEPVAEKYRNESIRTLNELEKAEIEAEEYRTQRVLTYQEDEYSF